MPFSNPPGAPKRNLNPLKWLSFIYRLLTKKLPPLPENFIVPSDQILKKLAALKNADSLTWLGHNALLIKLNNKILLTDPFLTDSASPFASMNPKRFSPPALSVSQLPEIDIIVVSHDHYDHLDLRTLAAIPNKEIISVVVPLKNGNFFRKLGYQIIYELDWHKSITIGDITIRALPSYHYSKRSLFSRNTRLWANYLIDSGKKKIFFDGNSAYGPIYLDLGRDYGPFDYALMSIGAYEPHDLMQESHVTPELAVKISQELRAKVIIPIHWGTIMLSDEPPFEPPIRFHQAAITAGYPEENIWILKIGETKLLV